MRRFVGSSRHRVIAPPSRGSLNPVKFLTRLGYGTGVSNRVHPALAVNGTGCTRATLEEVRRRVDGVRLTDAACPENGNTVVG